MPIVLGQNAFGTMIANDDGTVITVPSEMADQAAGLPPPTELGAPAPGVPIPNVDNFGFAPPPAPPPAPAPQQAAPAPEPAPQQAPMADVAPPPADSPPPEPAPSGGAIVDAAQAGAQGYRDEIRAIGQGA